MFVHERFRSSRTPSLENLHSVRTWINPSGLLHGRRLDPSKTTIHILADSDYNVAFFTSTIKLREHSAWNKRLISILNTHKTKLCHQVLPQNHVTTCHQKNRVTRCGVIMSPLVTKNRVTRCHHIIMSSRVTTCCHKIVSPLVITKMCHHKIMSPSVTTNSCRPLLFTLLLPYCEPAQLFLPVLSNCSHRTNVRYANNIDRISRL